MSKSRKKFLCLDCSQDTGKMGEHYFVNTDLWMKAVGSNKGMLCICCLEARIGRILQPSDFPEVCVNDPRYEYKSDLLMNRIGEKKLAA